MGIFFRTVVLVLAVGGASADLTAQEQGRELATGDGVPLEFVRVLSAAPFGTSAPRVLVGGLPEGTARVLPLPDEARIVGSLVYPIYAVSAVAVPGGTGTVRDDWVERMLGAGWTRYQPPSRGGFESNPTEGLQFCMGDSVSLTLGVSANPSGGSYVHVMRPIAREYSICQNRERPGMQRHDSLIPSLASPRGAVAMGSGAGGGGYEWEAHGRICTDLTMDQLLDHYGSQLREHGWEARGQTSGEGVAVEVFRVVDSEEAAWHGVLVVSAPEGASDRFLSLRLTRVERPF